MRWIVLIALIVLSCKCKKDIDPADNEANNEDTTVVVQDAGMYQLVATDALGRRLPTCKEAGDVKKDKYVGLFYWIWHTELSEGFPANDLSKLLAQYPQIINDYDSPLWPTDEGYYYWGKPLFDYYIDTDKWVLRKHAEMLADAGVDVIFFDCSNGSFTWRESYLAVCEVFADARRDGIKTPQIAFLMPFAATEGSKIAIGSIYGWLYQEGTYRDLFFKWDGKPLIMGYPDNLTTELKNYFSFRPGQGAYNAGPTRSDHWGWLEIYPQHGFGAGSSGGYEQVTVGVAQNWSKERGLTAMNAPGVFGRSYTNSGGTSGDETAVNYGYNFQEQWDRALELDPEFVFVTGWNEWIAGRQEYWEGQYNAFPDLFSQECSRDIEPMKGGHGDNYYMQLVSNIRRFKGMEAPVVPSAPKTVLIDGNFDDWKYVSPRYVAHKGSTMHRSSSGWKGVYYTNTTGRNDFVAAKVARSDEDVYFYIETADIISDPSDEAWMRLLIDTDRNKGTGWEGYDYLVNRSSPGETATLEKNTNGWNWTKVGMVDYAVSGNRMEIRIPKSLLQIKDKVNIEFKWSDNMQDEGDIMDFYVNGDVAPGGRFNYLFSEVIE
jgi:hypothetical protein